jgi:uncharacterized protein YbjQ (UPF0145 family)
MRWWISTLALMVATGCGAEHSHVRDPSEAHSDGHEGATDHEDEPLPSDPATLAKAASVRVIQNDSLGCTAEALGPIDVHRNMESTQQALEALKLRAAALGADAIIGVDFEHGEGGNAPTHLSGMAVRCRDLLGGRSYDVLGKVEVRGSMGKEEDAFSELKAKARAMRADLVLGVKFEHGEGGEGEPTVLTGTAIRIRDR